MTCTLWTVASLRARAEGLYRDHQAAACRGDVAEARSLWARFRDADWTAYQAEREEERDRLVSLYPEA